MSQPDARFTFDWRKSHFDYRLPVLIALSLFAHIFGFYLFRVVYPATTALLPPSAQVTVLDANRTEDKEILDWVTTNDPASVSAPKFDSGVIARVAPRYRPIYSTLSVPLRSSDSAKPKEEGIPSIFSTETLLPIRPPLPVAGSPTNFPTNIELASTLQPQAPAEMPKLPVNPAVAEPTSLFVGVNPEGNIDYLFLMQSSGNSAIDKKAIDFIRKVKFKPAPNRTWGAVTFRWGGTAL
jgi:TonB family protein